MIAGRSRKPSGLYPPLIKDPRGNHLLYSMIAEEQGHPENPKHGRKSMESANGFDCSYLLHKETGKLGGPEDAVSDELGGLLADDDVDAGHVRCQISKRMTE